MPNALSSLREKALLNDMLTILAVLDICLKIKNTIYKNTESLAN